MVRLTTSVFPILAFFALGVPAQRRIGNLISAIGSAAGGNMGNILESVGGALYDFGEWRNGPLENNGNWNGGIGNIIQNLGSQIGGQIGNAIGGAFGGKRVENLSESIGEQLGGVLGGLLGENWNNNRNWKGRNNRNGGWRERLENLAYEMGVNVNELGQTLIDSWGGNRNRDRNWEWVLQYLSGEGYADGYTTATYPSYAQPTVYYAPPQQQPPPYYNPSQVSTPRTKTTLITSYVTVMQPYSQPTQTYYSTPTTTVTVWYYPADSGTIKQSVSTVFVVETPAAGSNDYYVSSSGYGGWEGWNKE